MKTNPREVTPLTGAAPYIGGKRFLARRLAERIQKIPHACYAEPFLGMGGVFFARSQAPRMEVVNDLSGEVTNFFRVLQRHPAAIVEELRWKVTARAEFGRLTREAPETLTDVERAARFYYLQRTCFGGRVLGRSFGVDLNHPVRFNIRRLAEDLDAFHARLAGVVIEQLPYQEFIPRYDRAGTLFYIDPPYREAENVYGRGMFAREDFARLAAILAGLKGRFLLSLNDHPEGRRLFGAFRIERVPTAYSVMERGAKRTHELIVSWP